MLAEYLRNRNQSGVSWCDTMPGIQVCSFRVEDWSEEFSQKSDQERVYLEVVFCRNGQLTIQQEDKQPLILEGRDVLILSHTAFLERITVDGVLEGILIQADMQAAQKSLTPLWGLFGNSGFCIADVKHCMEERNGLIHLRNHSWCQSAFPILDMLKEGNRGEYCVWKTIELLYLLCQCGPIPDPGACSVPVNDRMARRIEDMRTYMEQHLHEKLTISSVCSQFYLSPTSFKKYFRRIYGQPVHRWLQQCRMEQAARQLRSSDLTVLQIAQGVGYDGLSQFNAIFKRYFGCTPRQYRNASKSVNTELIPQDITT